MKTFYIKIYIYIFKSIKREETIGNNGNSYNLFNIEKKKLFIDIIILRFYYILLLCTGIFVTRRKFVEKS